MRSDEVSPSRAMEVMPGYPAVLQPGAPKSSPLCSKDECVSHPCGVPQPSQQLPRPSPGWRQAGFDARETILPAALSQDPEQRASFPGMFTNNTGVGESTLVGASCEM